MADRYPTGPKTSTNPSTPSVKDVGPIIIFCYWGFVVVFLTAFQICKFFFRRQHPPRPVFMNLGDKQTLDEEVKKPVFVPLHDDKNPETPFNQDARLDVLPEKAIQFQGQRETLWGRSCYALICLTSLQWVALLIVILYDFYANCQCKGIDNWCYFGSKPIFGSYLMNGQVFFVVWILNGAWFTTLIAMAGHVRNKFRMQCGVAQASSFVVWAPNESEILSSNVMYPVLVVRRLKNILSPPSMRGSYTTVNVSKTRGGQRFFLYQGIRFLIKDDTIYRGELRVGDDYADFHQSFKGLSTEEANIRLDHCGPNEIPFKVDNFWRLLNNEFVSFFYNYQWVFYQLWFWFSYLFPAIIMSTVVLTSAFFNIYLTHRAQVAIAKLSEYVTEVEVLRDGQWVKADSRTVVPGDVVRLRSNWLLPADFVIIKGSCVCNESALTGEAMPVQKYECPNDGTKYDVHHGAKHMLFSGTTLLQAGSNAGDEVLAVVSATGMSTGKGELLSEILYPQAMVFKYDEELILVLIMLFTYAGVCAILSIIIQVIKGQDSDWVTKWIYMTFIISQILSPVLPVALNVGQMNASERLKKRGVNCLNAKRIAISGKIRIFCFDKTGTLTKDGLDFLGVRQMLNGVLQPLETNTTGLAQTVSDSLASCHAVSTFGEGYVGNQVEVKMFEATGWKLIEQSGKPTEVLSTDGKRRLTMVRKNEFDHARATMSVVVKDETGHHYVFCKGSFEKIGDISLRESIPEGYMSEAQGLALEGCYVLGMSCKSLGQIRSEEALNLSRNQIEDGLTLIALLAFRNELKPDTRDAIIEMKEGAVRPVMITGDNAQCGQYIAKACGMTAAECPLYLADVINNHLQWKLTGTENAQKAPLSSEELMNQNFTELQAGRMELAMTGKAFRVLRTTSLMSDILYFCRIFARVTPEEKVQVCNLFRDAGVVIGMAGDGGNDCGALRAAHAGVALSDAEASVVSPFTSKSKSVASVVDLLREGRGALHTSFAALKFLIIYGLNFSLLKLTSYWFGIIVSPFMYLSIDAFAILTLGYAITLSHPAKKLPLRRPTSSLIGPLQVASNFGYWFISVFYMVGAIFLMKSDPDYVPWPITYAQGSDWWTLGDNFESTILFFILYFNFITASFIYSFGSEFRRIVFRNWLLICFWGFLMVFYSWLLLTSENSATRYYHIASQPFNQPGVDSPVWAAWRAADPATHLPSPGMSKAFRFKFWALCMANCVTCAIWQKVFAEGVVSNMLRKRFPSKRPQFNM